MEINEAIEILEKHNAWRRREDDEPQKGEHPVTLGIAIDTIVEHHKRSLNKDAAVKILQAQIKGLQEEIKQLKA